MNGKLTLSCMKLTVDCDGTEITTIEGLSDPVTGELHPIQQAFIENNGTQCGFCAPGMVLASKALLDKNPNPTEEDVKWALAGNICRCGNYNPYAHAKILNIDTTEAEKLPGVKAVVTAKDSGMIRPEPFEYWSGTHADFYVLPPEVVYIAGEQIAAVAAETKEIAEEAIKLIKVEYEPSPGIFDPIDALKPDAQVIYPDLPDNKAAFFGETDISFARGDVKQGFKDADVILQSRYQWPTTAHAPLEPYQTVAQWHGDNLTIWISTQALWESADYISRSLGIPTNKITVINKWVGGGFGGKVGLNHVIFACIAAALAKKAGRPVRSLLEMDEQFIMSHHNCGPGYYDIKGGIKLGDGRPVSKDTVVYVNDGGHAYGMVQMCTNLTTCKPPCTRHSAT